MLLTKSGITVDVIHPSDIRRYKSLGYVEEEAEKASESKPKSSRGKPGKTEEKEEGDE